MVDVAPGAQPMLTGPLGYELPYCRTLVTSETLTAGVVPPARPVLVATKSGTPAVPTVLGNVILKLVIEVAVAAETVAVPAPSVESSAA